MVRSNNMLRSLFDFALPPRCPGCGSITQEQNSFCVTCWQSLDFLAGPSCVSCQLPLPFSSNEESQCAACMASPPLHNGIKAAVAYCDLARTVVLRFKYGRRIGLAYTIAAHLRRYLEHLPDGAIFIPVPLHWTRLWGRSFNQAELIARILAKDAGQTLIPDLLVRKRRTQALGKYSARERAKIVSGAFAISPRYADRVRGKNIALVDDVYTTGATTDACVKILKKAGANSVTIFCWARVLPMGLERSDLASALAADA
ncbi:MAG: ComF family protein [Sphingomonadales bacterium]|jgi:ComF family protein|nr:ComF family protein [Sphingomonadales bacterium]